MPSAGAAGVRAELGDLLVLAPTPRAGCPGPMGTAAAELELATHGRSEATRQVPNATLRRNVEGFT